MSKAKNRKVLYLPSTPLNLLVSVAHAVAYASEQTAQLVLIDQKSSKNNIYFKVLQSWSKTPFQQVALTLGRAKGRDKLVERKANFLKLAELVEAFPADVIAVGSDRRVEFQYVMYLRTLISNQVEGWYLDDGLYSYTGRPYRRDKDLVNSMVKKLIYGFWWQEPKTVGASNWIKQTWLFRPKNAVRELQSKQTKELKSDWFTHVSVRAFSQQVCKGYGLEQKNLKDLREIDLFLLIPHPNNIKKMPGYQERIEKFLIKMKALDIRIAAKYHPRAEQQDSLQLVKKYQTILVSAGLAFEFVLPLLKKQSVIVGDVGTALLTARWLRPDLKVCAVLSEADQFQRAFKLVYAQLGVSIVTDFNGIPIPSVVSSG